MKLVFSRLDVQAALAQKFRITPDCIVMNPECPDEVASSEKVEPPKKTGRLKGSKTKKVIAMQQSMLGEEDPVVDGVE